MAKSATRMRFDRAFRDARDSGDKTFEFEGKSYSTRIAGEGKSTEKSIPLPPKRDVPIVEDPEKKYPEEPVEASPRDYYNQKLSESSDVQVPPTAPKKSRTSMFERMPNPYEKAAKSDATEAPSADLVPDIYKGERQVPDQQYRKGGMVKKKSGGMMKNKSGGAVRGAGVAQRGQGKMRMF